MTVLQTVAVAFSMFSALPMPRVEWSESNLRYALCAFPLIGLVLGGGCWLWWALCGALELPALLGGGGLCLIPVAVTGGIHLDGYADTWDARASHGDPARRQEILKDPHLGAFAAIRLCGWFVADFALWTALLRLDGAVVTAGFCLSRALSGLAVTTFPLARDTGLAHTFASRAHRRRVKVTLGAVSAALCALLVWRGGGLMALAALGVFLRYRRMARVEFGGLSGDLAGWFVQTAELWMLAALVLTQYGGRLL